MNAVLLITVLVLAVGGNTAVHLAPCKRTSPNNAFKNFVHKHVLQEAFDTASSSEWQRYLTNLRLCDRPIQSFVRRKDEDRFVQICNGHGKLQKDNLCTSTDQVQLFDLTVISSGQSCTVTDIKESSKYVTVACDIVENVCRPVHFECSQNNKPSPRAQTCGA